MLLTHLRETKGQITTLKRVMIGGSAVPEAIVRAFATSSASTSCTAGA